MRNPKTFTFLISTIAGLILSLSASGQPNLTLDQQNNNNSFNMNGNTLDATVVALNDGNSTASSSKIGLYFSTDQTLDQSDYFIGEKTVGSLPPNSTATRSISVNICSITPSVPNGQYFILFRFDDDDEVNESNETDNTWFTNNPVSLNCSRNLLAANDNINVSGSGGNLVDIDLTVQNDGSSPSGPGKVAFYASTDQNITTNDELLGTKSFNSISSNGTANLSLSADLCNYSNLFEGSTYYIGYIIDYQDSIIETDENDNVAGFATTITIDCDSRPNLTVNGSSSYNNLEVLGNKIETVNLNIINDGNSPTGGSSNIEFYISGDQAIDTSDYLFGTYTIGNLQPGDSSLISLNDIDVCNISPNVPDGDYYIGIVIDPNDQIKETSESDNNPYFAGGPDLFLRCNANPKANLHFSSADYELTSNLLTQDVTVENKGNITSGPTEIEYYISTSSIVDTTDIKIGSYNLNSIAPGDTVNIKKEFDLCSVAGISQGQNYYIGFIIDPYNQVKESYESDNRATSQTTIQAPSCNARPNLTEGPGTNLTANGNVVDISLAVENTGNANAGSSTVKYLISADNDFSTSNYLIDSTQLSSLNTGGQTTKTIVRNICDLSQNIPNGSYYVGAVIDANDDVSESGENDNLITFGNGPQLNLQCGGSSLPNLYVVDTSISTSDNSANITIEIGNDGNSSVTSSDVTFYASQEPVVSSDDIQISSKTITNLAAGNTVNKSLDINLCSLPAIAIGNSYFINYQLDAQDSVNEANEQDNQGVFTSNALSVTCKDPNLSVDDASGNYSIDVNNNTVDLTITVTNQGGYAVYKSEVAYYASTDNQINQSDYQIGSDMIEPTKSNADTSLTKTIDLTSVTPELPENNYYIGVFVDHQDTLSESNEDNNSWAFPNGPHVDLTTGIAEINDSKLNIYPNPADDVLNIENSNQKLTGTIYNATGQAVKEGLTIKPQKAKIDVAGLNDGVYLLKLENEDEIIEKLRFIKQK